MERKDLETPPVPWNTDESMGSDLNQHCHYHRCNGHSRDDCKILKKDI